MKKVFFVFICAANFAWAENFFEFCWKRVPNGQEILLDAGIEAPIDLLLGDYTKALGHNPSAKAVLRDAMKLPSALVKAGTGTRVGGTEFVFDRSQVYSQLSKTILKGGGTVMLVTVFEMPAKHAAVWANYPGDIMARYLVKAGQYRQKENSTRSFEEYLFQESEPGWWVDTLLEVGPKILVCNRVGALVEKAQLGMTVRSGVVHMANRLAGTHINPSDTFWKNAKTRGPLVFAIMTAAYFFEKIAVTYVMAPAARITMDGITELAKYLKGSHDEL